MFSITERLGTVGPECMIYLSLCVRTCVCACACVCLHATVCACEPNQKNKDWGWSSVNYFFMLPFYQLLILLQGWECMCMCVCICIFRPARTHTHTHTHECVCAHLCVYTSSSAFQQPVSRKKLNSSSSRSFWNRSAMVLATVTDHTTSSVIVNVRRVSSVSVSTHTPTRTRQRSMSQLYGSKENKNHIALSLRAEQSPLNQIRRVCMCER